MTTRRILVAFAILLTAGSAWAQRLAHPQPAAAKEFTPPPRVGIIGATPLTLQQVIDLALANNPSLKAAGLERNANGFTLEEARAAWMPLLGLNTGWENAVQPVASFIGGGANGSVTQRTYFATPQLSGLIPDTGGSYRIQFSSTRLWTDNQFVTLNPQYPSALTFSLTQPLWRGLRFSSERRGIELARSNLALSRAQFRQAADATVTQAVITYWNLRFAEDNLRVQTEAVRLAERSLQGNQRMADRGLLAPIDVVAARTQVDQFKDAVYAAQASLTQAENDVKLLILPDGSDPLWNSALIAVTPMTAKAPVVPLQDALASALRLRPELAESAAALAADRVNTRYQHEQTKPQVNLVASVSSAGLAGQAISQTTNPLTAGFAPLLQRLAQLSTLAGLPPLPPLSTGGGIPVALIGGPRQSFANLTDWSYPTAAVSLQISLPLHNRAAQSALAAARIKEARAQAQRRGLETQIQANVRNALQAVASAQHRLITAQDARRSAEQQYASEERQFRAGLSSTFLVLQRQTSMISARSCQLQAETALGEAAAQLQQAMGTILQTHHVHVQP